MNPSILPSAAASHRANDQRKPRVLFMAEAVTLAHLARPISLARALDPNQYEVLLATDPRYDRLLGDLSFGRTALHSIPSAQFLRALAQGTPVYDTATLCDYVEEDLRLIRDFDPDLIVGDLRLSLSVSARLTHKRYATITNAYWSPYSRPQWIMPALPMVRWFGVTLAQTFFKLARPAVMAAHTLPMNGCRRRYGLPSLGWNLRQVYTDADDVLMADLPELADMSSPPANHYFLGPIHWSPPIAKPAWWEQLPAVRPVIYVTLGSSGSHDALHTVVGALMSTNATLLIAAAGAKVDVASSANIFATDYLPGADAAARADLVICNGGSPTTSQALTAGKPVLGIPGNMDQHMNMAQICKSGVGLSLRSDALRPQEVRQAVERLLRNQEYRTKAGRLAEKIAEHDANDRFQRYLHAVFAIPQSAASVSHGSVPATIHAA